MKVFVITYFISLLIFIIGVPILLYNLKKSKIDVISKIKEEFKYTDFEDITILIGCSIFFLLMFTFLMAIPLLNIFFVISTIVVLNLCIWANKE